MQKPLDMVRSQYRFYSYGIGKPLKNFSNKVRLFNSNTFLSTMYCNSRVIILIVDKCKQLEKDIFSIIIILHC